jgi:DNA polymerase-1
LVVANHPNHECDDIISHLAHLHASNGDTVTVASTDTDFLQLANTIDGYQQYNPIRKSYTKLPEHDYVAWKALVGDTSDNIVGFHGIGNKRALGMLESPEKLEKFLETDGHRDKFELNKKLISFIDVSNEENMITFSNTVPDWSTALEHFTKMNFKSMTSEKGWTGFLNAFGGLSCNQ